MTQNSFRWIRWMEFRLYPQICTNFLVHFKSDMKRDSNLFFGINENKLEIPQFGRSHWTELGSSSQRERKKKTASFTFAAQQGAVKSRDISRVQSSQGVSDDLWCKPYKKRKNIYDIFGYFFLSLCYHSVTNSFYQSFMPMIFWPLVYHWKTSLKN